MERTDRRDAIALDKACEFYRELVADGSTSDVHKLANSLKTVNMALEAAEKGELELTIQLWQKIRQALFDNLLTGFPSHIVAITADGRVLSEKEALPDDCLLELYPEGLRRADDSFTARYRDLHPHTRGLLDRVWRERGPSLRREDFALAGAAAAAAGCEGGVCAMRPNSFVLGADVLTAEAQNGRQKAYREYWRLYWQSYCSSHAREKQYLVRQMASLEAVWGNLNY